MFKKIFFAIVFPGSAMLLALNPTEGLAQEGVLKVHVTDSINKEAISFAAVRLESGGVLTASGQTDVEGNLTLKNLAPGTYTIKTMYVGYPTDVMSGVVIANRETNYLDITLSSAVKKEFVFRDFKKPLINPVGPDKVTFVYEELKRSVVDPMTLITQGTGAVSKQEGMAPSFHGARPDANVIYIDGQRVIGSADIPRMGVEQIAVTLGGVPAQFGDGTGGFIELETRSGLVNHGK